MVLSLDTPPPPPLAPAWTSLPSPHSLVRFPGLLTTLDVACVSLTLSGALPFLQGPAPCPAPDPGGPLPST